MSALSDARAHLAKAREFLTAAELNLDLEFFNVAASNAVISGINSKDAVCMRLTGTTAKTENHAAGIAELRAAGGHCVAQPLLEVPEVAPPAERS